MSFPDCQIFTMQQRSQEWYDIRKGVLTASQAGSWLADVPAVRHTVKEMQELLTARSVEFKKSASRGALIELCVEHRIDLPLDVLEGTKSARLTAASRLMAEIAGCAGPPDFEVDPDGPPPRNPALWAIWNGINAEADALDHFTQQTGLVVAEVGFCKSRAGAFGCSPDALIPSENSGLEGKAPIPATHCKYLMAGVLPDEYRDQVHFSMAVTGADSWWFQSYCHGLPTLRLKIERDSYTEQMLEGAKAFDEYLTSQQETLCKLWDEQLGKKEVAA